MAATHHPCGCTFDAELVDATHHEDEAHPHRAKSAPAPAATPAAKPLPPVPEFPEEWEDKTPPHGGLKKKK